MMFIVGFLELISEVARILSFTFRLLGNIFAGGVLLLVMTFIVPFFIPMPFLGLELFVGFIQALVFAMLALVFMNMAMAEPRRSRRGTSLNLDFDVGAALQALTVSNQKLNSHDPLRRMANNDKALLLMRCDCWAQVWRSVWARLARASASAF